MRTSLDRLRPYVKEGSWIVIGQIASVSGALVLVRVLTEHLTPAEYGQLALGLTVTVLIGQVVMAGVTPGITRFYSIATEKEDLGGYVKSAKAMMGYATLVVLALGAALLAGVWYFGHWTYAGMVVAALILSIFGGYNGSISGLQNAARQRSIVAFHNGLEAWLKILAVLLVAAWFWVSSTSVLVGYIGASCVVTISQLVFLRRTIPANLPISDTIHPSWLRQMAAYSLPFAAWGIFSCGQQVSDRWALEALATTGDVGRYALLFQLGYSPILMLTGMTMSFIGPILFQRSGDASDPTRNDEVHRLAWRISHLALFFTLGCFLATHLLHRPLFNILASEAFRDASYLLPWFVLAGGVYSASQMLALKLMSDMKSRTLLIAKIVTSIVAITLNIAGVFLAGIHGLVASLVLFSVLSFVWMAALNRGVCRRKSAIGI